MEPFDYTIPKNATRWELRLKQSMAEKRLGITTPGTPEYQRLAGFIATLKLEMGKLTEERNAKLDASIDAQADQLKEFIGEVEAARRNASRISLAQRLYSGQLHKQPDPAAAADKAIELANVFFDRWDQQPTT
jgi:hypothetical protein